MKKINVEWLENQQKVQIEIEEKDVTIFFEWSRSQAQDFMWKLQEVVMGFNEGY